MKCHKAATGRTLLLAGFAAVVLAGCSGAFAGLKTVTPIYAATANGLSVFDGSGWTNITTSAGLASNTINGVSVVGDGSTAFIYAATPAGLAYNEGSGWSTLTTSNGLPADDVLGVFAGTNYLEMVTANTGVTPNTYNLSVFNYTTGQISTKTLPAPWVNTTAITGVFPAGETYVATAGNGLFFTEVGSWVHYSTADSGFPSNTVNAVFVDQNSNIYAGTPAGLGVWSSATTSWSTYSLPGNPVITSLFVDTFSTIYAGTDSGLFVSYNGGISWVQYTTADGLGSNTINGVFVVGTSIYLATNGGLSVSTNGGTSWTTYTTADGLGSNTVNAVYVTAPLYTY